MLVVILKSYLLDSRQAQTLSVKERKTMRSNMLEIIGTAGLEVTQGLGVGVTAGAVLT